MKDYLLKFHKRIDKITKIGVLWMIFKMLFTQWPEIKQECKDRMVEGDEKWGDYRGKYPEPQKNRMKREELCDLINYDLF